MTFLLKQCLRTYHAAPIYPSGLTLVPLFLDTTSQTKLLMESRDLIAKINNQARIGTSVKSATYLSKQHNLKSEESYKLVRIDKTYDAQHFESYGEEGHALTYFINNKNIPSFVKTDLIARLLDLQDIKELQQGDKLNWNFTFNTYKASKQNPILAGFPFHIDTPTNGEISAIITLGSEAEMQMKRPEDKEATYSTQLIPGSLLLLSGESRWKWEHRVVPRKVNLDNQTQDAIQRISLVLGCR